MNLRQLEIRRSSLDKIRTSCLFALLVLPQSAHAYLDPGTGSLLFQSFLAVLFGVGVAFRQLRSWIARMWAFILRRPAPSEDGRK